jgi:diguanylate cyclase (GGDEF)-like protein
MQTRLGADVPCILVLDDDPIVRRALTALAERHAFEAIATDTTEEAVRICRERSVFAAVCDVHLAGGETALELPAKLRGIPGYENLPVAFVSGDASEVTRIAAARTGATVYLTKPFEPEALVAVVHQLIANRDGGTVRVLQIGSALREPDEFAAAARANGFSISLHAPPSDLFETFSRVRPELLFVALDDPAAALDVCHLIRTTPIWRELPTVVATPDLTASAQLESLTAGADAVIPRDATAIETLDLLRLRAERARRARLLVDRDMVTGLSVRRSFLDTAAIRFDECRRHGQPLTLCIIDIDCFKNINDSYGHSTGDRVLASFGRLMQLRLRQSDLRGRLGGEEFAIAFPVEDREGAYAIVTRLLDEFSAQRQRASDRTEFHVTFSAGLATFPADGRSLSALIERADSRMYAAKEAGRARVVYED